MRADEQVIQGILQEIETARNRYDSVSLAAVFAEDANFIKIFGGQLDGRRAIEAAHRHTFQTVYRVGQASFVLRSIRFLRADVAVVFVRCHVKFKEGNEAPVSLFPVNAHYHGGNSKADYVGPHHSPHHSARIVAQKESAHHLANLQTDFSLLL